MSKAYLCRTDLDNNEHSTNNSILQALSVKYGVYYIHCFVVVLE